MVYSTDRGWYIAIDVILFLLATITFLLFYRPVREQLSVSIRSGDAVINAEEEQSIYLGQKSYEGTHLSGNTWETVNTGEYVSREGLFQELLHMPESVEYIRINGTTYINREGETESINGLDNLYYRIQNGETDVIYHWISSGTLFLKTYELDDSGQVTEIIYERV